MPAVRGRLALVGPLLICCLFLLIQALPRQSRQNVQQQQSVLPSQFPALQQPTHPSSGGPFPAQAFASKLAGPPLEAPRQAQPQFVANNGPLIRAPDGQFVLAQQVLTAQLQGNFPFLLQQQQFGPFQAAAPQQQSFTFQGQQPQFGQVQKAQQSNQQQPPFVNNNNNNPFAQPQQQFPAQTNGQIAASNGSPQPSGDGQASAHQESGGGQDKGIITASSPPSSSPSSSIGPTSPLPPVDKSVDLDGDGALSLNEVQYAAFVHHGLSSSVVENLFNEVDHNKDGFLSALEFNDIRPLVLAKAENAALRYLQNVDTDDHNGLLSLQEAQAYILREYGIGNRDVERIWRLVVPSSNDEMDAVLFSKLRRRVRGMSIRLARQILKGVDRDQDGHVDLREAQLIAFEQEGIGPAEVIEMLASVDDNNDGQLNAPEFADFERIVRAKAVETSKKALKVVDSDGSGSLTMEEARKIAFDHYGFDEATLEPFFAQADENEDGQLDSVEFAGFRSVIRGRAVKNALTLLPELDDDGDGVISEAEAEQRTRREDDMTPSETHGLFSVADQDRNGLLDKVELADFVRLVRLTSIKFVADHFRDYDSNRDKLVTLDELERLVKDRYKLDPGVTRRFFDKVDVDRSGDLSPGEIVDFRHEVRRFAQDRVMQAELEEQNRREMAEIEQRLRQEAEARKRPEGEAPNSKEDTGQSSSGTEGPAASSQTTSTSSTLADLGEEEQKQSTRTIASADGGEAEQVKKLLDSPKAVAGNLSMEASREEPKTVISPTITTPSPSSPAIDTQFGIEQPNGTAGIATTTPSPSSSPRIPPNHTPTIGATKTTITTDSIGTTTKKQRKRRRKTTTAAPTTTTTNEAAEESYEEETAGGEQQEAPADSRR